MERTPEEASPSVPEGKLEAARGPGKATAFDPRDLVPEPIFCCDGEGRLIWVNHAAEKLCGHASAALLGQPFSTLIAPTKRRRLASYFIRHLHLKEEAECERDVPMLTKDGRTAWVGARVRRVRTLHGRVGYVACAHDLHDLVFEIERLRREARDLSVKLGEAVAAARLKEGFLAAMTEEIRTPMDGLISMTRLLLESNLDRDQRTFAEVIHDSGETLLTLVNDVLDFSKIEAGALTIESMDFDVRVTVDGVAVMLSPAANAKGVNLARAVHHDVPSQHRGDPGRLRQVLTNLIRSILQVVEGGEIHVRVNLVEETPHEATLRFSVSYSGPDAGDPLDRLAEIFATPDLSRMQLDGEGLAIAISRKLVVLMGGEVGRESRGGGVQFWFQVPFQRAESRAAAPPLPDVDLRDLRVLVADPSVGIRLALTEVLASWGCLADEAETGPYALTLLQEAARQRRPYRVALIENQLPGMDGEDLARAVRSNTALAGTQLILLSAVGRRGDAVRAQELGYSAYLVKPFEPSHLKDAVVEVVHRAEEGVGGDLLTRHSVAERRRQRTRVLLVEDNTVNQLVAVAALRRAGYQPVTLASGSEAVREHAARPFDLIFLDVELPDMDGLEAAKEILRQEEDTGRRTPIVGLAGDASFRERCLAAGLKDCLLRPIDLESFTRAVERWIQPEAEAAESAEPEGEAAAGESQRPAESAAALASAATPGGNKAPGLSLIAGRPPAPADETSEEAEPVLDESRLRASSMGNAELEGILLRTFLHHVRPRLTRLREAAAGGDAAVIEFEAHGLKGMCSTIGAVCCADVFGRIERLGREKRLEPVAPMLDYAEIEVTRVEALVIPKTKAA